MNNEQRISVGRDAYAARISYGLSWKKLSEMLNIKWEKQGKKDNICSHFTLRRIAMQYAKNNALKWPIQKTTISSRMYYLRLNGMRWDYIAKMFSLSISEVKQYVKLHCHRKNIEVIK